MATFKVGDQVKLKPNQGAEDEVLAFLSYDTIYTVSNVEVESDFDSDDWGHEHIAVEGVGVRWLAHRFEPAVPVPARGDVVEVVIRARVSAVQEVGGPKSRTVIYFEDAHGDSRIPVSPIYLCSNSAVQALTVIEPAKPKLDLDALPEGTLVERVLRGGLGCEIYRKDVRGAADVLVWLNIATGCYTSAPTLLRQDGELIELVRKAANAE